MGMGKGQMEVVNINHVVTFVFKTNMPPGESDTAAILPFTMI